MALVFDGRPSVTIRAGELRQPIRSGRLDGLYPSSDNTRPGPAGYAATGQAFDLGFLAGGLP